MHRNPRFWGEDADEFKPGRFDGRVKEGKGGNGKDKKLENTASGNGMENGEEGKWEESAPGASSEKLTMPVKGAFVPFSEGSRMCLGTP